ncbi:MAG: dephospho-CoA kinase [Oscillospiraceae bacterium]|jgi:dephospho-CoA kinase|nr:dephospho-CoA kinase [Oscillospiraceae bacterium]
MFPGIPIPVIGLTGPTGAGKSLAAGIFRDLGCAVLDGDVLARKVQRPGSPVLGRLAETFGPEILRADGSLDRAALAARAFASQTARALLNEITHPAIHALAAERAAALPPGIPALVIDAAALLESEFAARCDHIVLVTAPEELRLRRILARDGIPAEAALRRIKIQPAGAYDISRCDTVIENTGNPAGLRPALEGVLVLVRSQTGP